MLADELDEAGDGLFLVYATDDAFLADVEIDATRAAADVSEVGVRHLARSVHDASHDGDLEALEVLQLGRDARLRNAVPMEKGGAPVLDLVLLGMGALVTGCKTDQEPENADSKPWNTPKNWEHGLPSGMWERR